MARVPVFNCVGGFPDDSGGCYTSRVDAQLTMTNAKKQPVMVMEDPTALSANCGFECHIRIPDNYSSAGKLVITGILDGTVASNDTLAFGITKKSLDDNESADQAYDSEETITLEIQSGTSHSDKDYCEAIMGSALSGTIAAGDIFELYIYRDQSADDYGGNFLAFDLQLDYTTT